MESPTPDLVFDAAGRSWRLRRADMEALWENMAAAPSASGDDERLPYWAELWPSSLALAEWLAARRERIAGRDCLDLGCGLGLTALVGQWLGGRVTGLDYEEEALRHARQNAEINNVPGVAWLKADWREAPPRPGGAQVIWAGDIMYERVFAVPVAAFLAAALAPEGVAWIAEPGRAVFRALLDELPRHGLRAREVQSVAVRPLTPQEAPVPVTIWEIAK